MSVCEFACQFHKDSYFWFERGWNEVPDSDESDVDDNRYSMVSRKENFKNNLGYNISNLLNWEIFVNYYQSNDNFDQFEKAEYSCLFVDEVRDSILKVSHRHIYPYGYLYEFWVL